jgi:hypothetical protein
VLFASHSFLMLPGRFTISVHFALRILSLAQVTIDLR